MEAWSVLSGHWSVVSALPIEVGPEVVNPEEDSQQLPVGDAVVPLWSAEGTAAVGHNLLTVFLLLGQH